MSRASSIILDDVLDELSVDKINGAINNSTEKTLWYNLNEDSVQEGLFGINIHRATKYAGKKSTQVDKWSAGCQVIASNDDWKLFMKICRKARDTWSNNFTYTLLDSDKLLQTWL